jgi:hypothetical protein
MEKPPFQFGLRTLFRITAILAIWLAALAAVRPWPFFARNLARVCITLAFLGPGCLICAARLDIGQDWRLGGYQLGIVVLGIGLLIAAGFFVFMSYVAYNSP